MYCIRSVQLFLGQKVNVTAERTDTPERKRIIVQANGRKKERKKEPHTQNNSNNRPMPFKSNTHYTVAWIRLAHCTATPHCCCGIYCAVAPNEIYKFTLPLFYWHSKRRKKLGKKIVAKRKEWIEQCTFAIKYHCKRTIIPFAIYV